MLGDLKKEDPMYESVIKVGDQVQSTAPYQEELFEVLESDGFVATLKNAEGRTFPSQLLTNYKRID